MDSNTTLTTIAPELFDLIVSFVDIRDYESLRKCSREIEVPSSQRYKGLSEWHTRRTKYGMYYADFMRTQELSMRRILENYADRERRAVSLSMAEFFDEVKNDRCEVREHSEILR